MNTRNLCRAGSTLLLALVSLGAASLGAAPFNIRTVAGTGNGGFNGDNQTATQANVSSPIGVYRSSSGDLYIAQFYASRVRRVDGATGEITTIAGTGTSGYNGDGIDATTAQLAGPSAVGEDAGGNLYISDTNNSRIRRIDAVTGLISTVAGTGTAGYNGDGILATAAQLWGPFDIAVDAAGNFYFPDRNSHRVRRVDVSTGLINTVAGTGTGGYNGDNQLATSAQLDNPVNVAMDSGGHLFISERHRVRRVDASTGMITTVAGTSTGGYNGDSQAATSAQLYFPTGIALDTSANLFIADRGNARIRRVDSTSGQIETVAGTGNSGFNGDDQPAVDAQVNGPNDVVVDASGSFYIADQSNNRIRKVSAFQPDNLIGASADPAAARGDEVYNRTGAGQTLIRKSRKARVVRATLILENDSAVNDSALLRGGLGNRYFGVTYRSGAGNITAAVGAGTYSTGVGAPGVQHPVSVIVDPKKSKLRKKIVRKGKRITKWRTSKIILPLTTTSQGDPGVSDTAVLQVKHRG